MSEKVRITKRKPKRRAAIVSLLACGVIAATVPVIQGTAAPALADEVGAAAVSYTNPVYESNAGDPAALRAPDGTFYAYTTQTAADGTGPHIPVLHSDDLVTWSSLGDALPELPSWALDGANRDTWAPHVIQHDGRYLLYYSARRKSSGKMAIGVATSETPVGPFHPVGSPLVGGDSIDPFVMKTPGGLYMYWMVPREPIRVQPLSDDGLRLTGSSTTILRPAPSREYEKLIEGPWIEKHDGFFYLFYSGNHCCAPNPHYALMVARSRYPRRGFKRYAGNPILAANDNFIAPGHNSVIKDDAGKPWTLYHAIRRGDQSSERVMMLDRVRWINGWPRVNGGRGPSSGSQSGPEVRVPI